MSYSALIEFFKKHENNPVYDLIKCDIQKYSKEELSLFLTILKPSVDI